MKKKNKLTELAFEDIVTIILLHIKLSLIAMHHEILGHVLQ